MALQLDDRVYLVTGGSRGLGFATAKFLVDNGAKVVLGSRDSEVLSRAVADLGGHDHAVGLVCDLADPSAAELLPAAAIARFGQLDGALISTGGPAPGGIMAVEEDQWRAAFETVVIGAIRVAKSAATTMESNPVQRSGEGGSIVMVLSTSVRTPLPNLAISNALRPGLAAAVKDLADALGPQGIRVNGIMPGRIATDRIFALDARDGSPERTRIRNEAAIPLGRYGEPDEFAAMAGVLLSPLSSYVTGSVMCVDGGATRVI